MNAEIDKGTGGTVLIVDDDFTLRLLAREALEQAGFKVLETNDGSMALADFENACPDIVLLDVMLPGIDGFTICKQIREHEEGRNTPILMMTGLDDVESIRHAYQAGATDFITKPFNWLILAYRVHYMMRSNRTFLNLGKSQDSLNYAQRIANLGSWEWDIVNNSLQFSDSVFRIFQVDPLGFDGSYQFFLDSVHPLDKKLVNAVLEKSLADNTPFSVDHQILLPDGSERYVHTEAEIFFDKNGRPLRASGIVQDITKRKLDEEKIRSLAFYDTLTGLPNRVLFKENLEHALAYAERKKRKVATLFLDLDRFKWINDTLGHVMGDMLLQEFSARLTKSVRKSDCITRNDLNQPYYAIARLGGDEFTIILDDIARPQDAAVVARRILEEVAKPFDFGPQEIYVTASIGISIYPDDGKDIVTLIKNADTAMYHAKELGKNNFQFYTKSMTDKAFEFLLLENQLRRALERDEFTLHYQPQVDIASGRMISMEALLRWHNPELGMIPPSTFIPLAEETGLIVKIDEWVMTAACRQIKAWEEADLPQVRVAVNLSGQNFQHKSLLETIRRIIADTGVRPESLELELTEGVLMYKGEETIVTLNALKAMGLSLAIDDFGTGYSSLSYLKRFPLNILKIDKSFVQNITSDNDSAAIVTAIVAMANSMNLETITEGVETVDQLNFLRNLGCRRMQGYHLDRPMPGDAMTQLLREDRRYLYDSGTASQADYPHPRIN